uniref:Ribosomal protein S4 n=1 Tax=Coscinodiscus wailesii TaxID=671091 RepID=A0A7T8G4Q7_9STRA|nr:ribosomal protein S4 [Coscinodiscus wailesii]QQP21842.1 ribosomal protein S4 [Coscinodiscus wailesii]
MLNKKNIYKPVYKKILKLRENVLNKNIKIFLRLKKKKWQYFIKKLLKNNKKARSVSQISNAFLGVYKYFDIYRHVLQYNCGTSKKKKFKSFLQNKQKFDLHYSKRSKTNIDRLIIKSKKKQKIFNLLESRLDVILYRSKFCTSIKNARQIIKHMHVLVNNSIITNYSLVLQKGDKITIKKQSKNLIKGFLVQSQLWPLPLQYVSINYRTLEIILNDTVKKYNYFIYFPFWFNINRIKNYK